MRYLALITCLLTASPALGWESLCFRPDGSGCEESDSGPVKARMTYLGEHAEMAQVVLSEQGYPDSLLEALEVVTYTDGGDAVGVDGLPTLVPATTLEAVEARQTRFIQIASFAELPDFSFSLDDWLTGNETCPLAGAPDDPYACHVYAIDFGPLSLGYLGPVNTAHFVPQAGAAHAHYHGLALGVAAECALLAERLGDAASAEHLRPYLEACDALSLSVEAVGLHFLQDVWSSGHMWHRWGGPELDDVGGVVIGGVVAAITGMIHGARSLVALADDPLTYPTEAVRWRLGDEVERGIGDIFLGQLETDPTFSAAWDHVRACQAGFLYAVYAAGAQSHQPPPAAAPAADPEACYGPRVTNAAFVEGFGLRILGVNIPLEPSISALVTLISFVPALGDAIEALTLPLRADLVALSFRAHIAALADPNGTQVATNTGIFGLGSLLGVEPNEAFLGHIPASYHDTAPPWDFASPEVQVFREAHARTWCGELRLTGLSDLAGRCADEPDDGEVGHFGDDREYGPCGLCEALADMVFRDGCGPDDPALRTDGDGVCRYVADDPAAVDYLYLPLDHDAGETRDDRIQLFCHGSAPVRLCDRLAVVDRRGGRLIGLNPGAQFIPDFALPVGQTPQRVAVTQRQPSLAVVSNGGEGSVSILDLANQRELDWDDDPQTTDPGAPMGISRLPAPGAMGVAITPDDRFALVASSTTNVLTVVDLRRGRITALVPLPAGGADSVVVDGPGTKAYVTLAGTIQAPDNRVAVVDVALATDGIDGNETVGLIEHVGGSSRPTRMDVHPDGTTMAFVMSRTNRAGVLDLVADEIVDLLPEDPARQFVLLDFPPTDVAWRRDGSTFYVLEVSSDALPGGAVRRALGPPAWRLGEPIPVGQSPRAMAVSADGHRAYVVNGDNTMTVLDLDADGVASTVDFDDLFLQVTPSDVVTW